jgi:hypothetical protein
MINFQVEIMKLIFFLNLIIVEVDYQKNFLNGYFIINLKILQLIKKLIVLYSRKIILWLR